MAQNSIKKILFKRLNEQVHIKFFNGLDLKKCQLIKLKYYKSNLGGKILFMLPYFLSCESIKEMNSPETRKIEKNY